MIILLTIVHVIVCVFLVIVVLLQSGKAADLAGAFGGMGSQTAFGPRGGATVLSKATTIAAALFMVTSLTLAIMASRAGGRGPVTGSSVLEKAPPPKKGSAPASPVPQVGGGQGVQVQEIPVGTPAPATAPKVPAEQAPASKAPAQKK